MTTQISLKKGNWTFDPAKPLGPAGGFGEVFAGSGPDGPVAVKRLKVEGHQTANRELSIGDRLSSRTMEHVVPVLDSGQDVASGRYFLVMPVCDGSLQDLLDREKVLEMSTARDVALEILAGLAEVPDIAHRDLKPGNVLRYQDRWAIADFGIAKFVSDATSLQTLRGGLTPSYGAPEQWRGERSTSKTDIYALGCIMYDMINGSPPFIGDDDEVREGHLFGDVPQLSVNEPRLANFVKTMLAKEPERRPSVERCRNVLSSVASSAVPAHAGLMAAAGVIAQKRAQEEARAAKERSEQQARDALVRDATTDVKSIFERLFETVATISDDATATVDTLRFGRAALRRTRIEPSKFSTERTEVAAWCKVELRQDAGRHETSLLPQFTAMLAFMRTSDDPDFRWREMAFWSWTQGPMEVFALDPSDQKFTFCFSNVTSSTSLAYGPWPIDAEDEEAFQQRWLNLFAKAAVGQLQRPNGLPLKESYFQ